MVVILLVYQEEDNSNILSCIYDKNLSDDFVLKREKQIKSKIHSEYLRLKSMALDRQKIENNPLSPKIVIDSFTDNYTLNKDIFYEGIILLDDPTLFPEEMIGFWKFLYGCIFVLVFNKEENVMMASSTLDLFENMLSEEVVRS